MTGGGKKKRFQYCADLSGAILYHRALHGHSGRNLIDPSSQDKVVICEMILRMTKFFLEPNKDCRKIQS